MFNKNVYAYDEMKRREHMAVRDTAGWYLWTHHLLEMTGEDATTFLETIFPKSIGSIEIGSERYTVMLDENAEIIDDVVIFRIEEQKYWISTLFIHYLIPWLDAHKGSYIVEYTDITPEYHMYAVQGPRSMELINAMVSEKVDDQKFFTIRDNSIEDVPVKINRAGFTGEKLGYEVYIASDKTDFIETKLREEGTKFGAVEVTEFQIMAWTLPSEAGFYYMRDLRHCNPFETGMEKGFNWDKDFVGKDALLKIRDEGCSREMLGFTVDEVDVFINARDLGGPGAPVIKESEEIGRVVKFNYSFVNEKNVGYMLVDKGAVKPGDKVQIKQYEAVVSERRFL